MNKKRGKLKIFLGYAAGVGKTYAMLKETHEQLALGKDIVVGYIEPHDRPETKRLIDGLEWIKTIDVHYKGRVFQELHLNAIIERMPECVVIDELAHSNTPGLRHEKRFGDIEELLNRGVDVYTTINIQHIESLHDLVESITGIPVNERVPDWMIDRADEIQLVDLEPSVLIQRLKDGKIYAPERAKQALQNFFTLPHLIALREIALRRIADSVHKRIPLEHAKEHILVGISSSPTNAKVIRTAARLVQSLHAEFSCVYVMDDSNELEAEDQERLQKNIELAEQLGGTVVILRENNPSAAIANYAKISGVTKVVLGKTMVKQHGLQDAN
ncbi:universal stress protein [Kurthia gibsonii]|uniref:universal stress protein n=1 Tax=Kurthia gibsonii TaxID=33946 RepID=UPI002DB7E981|nr:universal stress protein [Kurthia gibsonii]MEB7771164.1 universal stress protein [Kurthia gibsonii]